MLLGKGMPRLGTSGRTPAVTAKSKTPVCVLVFCGNRELCAASHVWVGAERPRNIPRGRGHAAEWTLCRVSFSTPLLPRAEFCVIIG